MDGKLKRLDFKEKIFTANNNTYYIEESLSYRRFLEYEKLQTEIGFGITFKELFDSFGELYGLLNEMKFADCAVLVRDKMTGVAYNIDARIPTVLRMCALFMNAEGEDRRTIDEKLFAQKFEDWEKEGIEMQSFFLFAINSIPGFVLAFANVTGNTSTQSPEPSENTTNTESEGSRIEAENSSTP